MSTSPPVNEARQETAHPSGLPKYWIVLGLLVLAHAVIGAYCTPSASTFAAEFVDGVRISQPVLLAIWAAFAWQRFYHRLLWSLLVCTYLSFAGELGRVQQETGGGSGGLILMSLALYAVLLVILLPIRRFFRWQITWPDAQDTYSTYLAHQLGISHLTTLTAIVALACGLVRSVFIITGSKFSYTSVTELIASFGLLLVAVLPCCVVPWITLGSSRKRYWLMLTIPLAAVLLCVACFVTVDLMFDPMMNRNSFFKMLSVLKMLIHNPLWLQLGAILSAIVSTIVLRFCDFRMIREPTVQA